MTAIAVRLIFLAAFLFTACFTFDIARLYGQAAGFEKIQCAALIVCGAATALVSLWFSIFGLGKRNKVHAREGK